MEKNINKIVENTINGYLINEGFWSNDLEVYVNGFDINSGHLLGTDKKRKEYEISVDAEGSDKVKEITANGENVKILNLPKNGHVIFLGKYSNRDNQFYGFDNQYRIIQFFYDSRSRNFLDLNNNVISVDWIPSEYMNQLRNTNARMGNSAQNGYYDNANNGYYNNTNDAARNEIINLNEPNPISKAIERLIQYRYIRDSKRATNLMNELFKLGL